MFCFRRSGASKTVLNKSWYLITNATLNRVKAGLGTAFFYMQNASFFCLLLKNATFFYFFFSSFWQLMRPQKLLRSFLKNLKECKECNVLLQRTQRSLAKNLKECKERNILMQKNVKERRTLHSFFQYIYIDVYRDIDILIYRYM